MSIQALQGTSEMANLINAFGKISLDETNKDTVELLIAILLELRVSNAHLAKLTNEEITTEEVERYGE